MKQRVKELRVRIDGLGQLVKGLKPRPLFKIDIDHLPDNLSLDEVVHTFEKTGYAVGKGNPFIDEIPTIFHEIEKATDSLFIAKAWLDEILGVLGEDSPYPKDGSRKTVEDIEPIADTSNLDDAGHTLYASDNVVLRDAILTQKDWEAKSYIENVDWLRESIKETIKKGIEDIENSPIRKDFRETALMWYWLESKKQLIVARFQLGFELERIGKEDER